MKIAVIGDLHYGSSFSLGKKNNLTGINTRLTDIHNTLIKTINLIIADGCEYIVFTGDIFEHRAPSVKQQELFSAALRHAIEGGIKQVFIVVGNHDQQRITRATTISYIKELPLNNIHVYDEMDMVEIKNDDGVVMANLIFMPFRDRKWFETDSNKLAIDQLDEALSYHLASIDNEGLKILVGHMTIEGTLWMLDDYSDLYNDGNDLILPTDMFRGIDITVMGHVHTPGVISKSPFIYYVGSMEKRGAFESHDKKFCIIDLEKKKFRPVTEPCRNIFDIKINLSNDTYSAALMDKLIAEVDDFATTHNLKDSIVRMVITIIAEDDKFCNAKALESYLYNTYSIEHCVEIKPSLVFSRQSRDSSITEHTSDTDAFSKYINTAYSGSGLKNNILSMGLEIIANEEV